MSVLLTFAVGFACGLVAAAIGWLARAAEPREPLPEEPRRTTWPEREVQA